MNFEDRIERLDTFVAEGRILRGKVHRSAFVLGLQGRLTFEGCDQPYPKDCLLAVYGADLTGFDVWNWRGGGRS